MKIGVIFTGGTIGSCQGAEGIAPGAEAPRRLLSAYREKTGDGYDFPTAEPYTILSENLTLSHLTALGECVREKAAEWEGIILTHGTDTLQYTAAALGYMLGLCETPVVLVSANYPLEDSRSNGVANFTAAVRFLRTVKGAKGVYVSYQNQNEPARIHRATRLLAHPAYGDAVHSLGGAVAEEKNGNIHPVAGYFEKEDGQPPLEGGDLAVSEGRILFLRVHPGMSYPSLEGVAAVLLETYHSGTVATAGLPLKKFAKAAKEKGVPLFLCGVPEGGTAYASGNLFDQLGLIPLPVIPPIAAYMKLCLSFAEGKDFNAALALPLGGDQ